MIFVSENEVSCPSKTFLCGEYSVLVGGHGLVLTHEPRFVLRARPKPSSVQGLPEWLHPRSPAGIWFTKHNQELKDWEFDFVDPHKGRGGFGASGAQFVLLHAFTARILKKPLDVFSDFKSCDVSNSSGSDVLAQALDGELVDVDPEQGMSYSLADWPFKNLDYLVCPTGQKISTHSHITSLNKKSLEPLIGISNAVLRSVVDRNQDQFLEGVRDFGAELKKQDLVAPHTLEFLEHLRKGCPGYKVAKGCGALGSDALIVVVEAEQAKKASDFVNSMGLRVLATHL